MENVFAVSKQQLTYNAHFTTGVILELEFFFSFNDLSTLKSISALYILSTQPYLFHAPWAPSPPQEINKA